MGGSTSDTIKGIGYGRGSGVSTRYPCGHAGSADGSSATGSTRSDYYFYGTYSATGTVYYPYHISPTSGYAGGRYYNSDAFPPATHTVAFNANGGSGAPSAITKTGGSWSGIPDTVPTRTGYSFQGGGTSSSDTTVDYSPGSGYTYDQNGGTVTLYAIGKQSGNVIHAYDSSGAKRSALVTGYNSSGTAKSVIISGYDSSGARHDVT